MATVLDQHQKWLRDHAAAAKRAVQREKSLPAQDLRNVDLSHAFFTSCNLALSSFAGSQLANINLECSDLGSVDFTDADLSHASLDSANLREANLLNANLYKANLQRANLLDAQFDHNIAQCWSFAKAIVREDAVPWLALHPDWGLVRNTVYIKIS